MRLEEADVSSEGHSQDFLPLSDGNQISQDGVGKRCYASYWEDDGRVQVRYP